MKKKIIGIFVCTLLIFSAFGSTSALTNKKNIENKINPSLFDHVISLHPPWDSHDNGHTGNSGGVGNSDSTINYGFISANSQVFLNGWQSASAWCEHSVDWICPCDVPDATIYISYLFSYLVDFESSWGLAEAEIKLTFFVGANEYIMTIFDQSGGNWFIEENDFLTGHGFNDLTLNEGQTYHIGVRAYVWTHVDMQVGGDCFSYANLQHDAYSSDPTEVEIIWENRAPTIPSKPSGPTTVQVRTLVSYTTTATDPDKDELYYQWDWGNEVSNWEGPYPSGDTISSQHSWDYQDTFSVRVRTKDGFYTTDWSQSLSITVPMDNKLSHPLLIRLLERLPYTFPSLQQLLRGVYE